MPEIIRNAAGEPFSKWKPAAKFEYVFQTPEIWLDLWKWAKPEYRFDETRAWRFDYAWPDQQLAVEIDGFGFGHQAQQRISQNNEKRNAAILAGWRVLVFDSRLLGSRQKVDDAVDLTAKVLCGYGQFERGYDA